MDSAASNFGVNPFEDAYDANGGDEEAPALVSTVSGLSFGSGDGEVVIAKLAVPIVIELPIDLPPTYGWVNCTRLLLDNNRSTDNPYDLALFDFNATFLNEWGNYTRLPIPGVDCVYEEPIIELPQCKYFDTKANEWSTEGCVTAGYTNTSIVCQCDHLTDFSGAMDEMEVDVKVNTVDPAGDALLLLNINPDNMLPIIALFTLYISYITMMCMSKKKLARYREGMQAKFMAGEDLANLAEAEEEEESEDSESSGSESSEEETMWQNFSKKSGVFSEKFGEGALLSSHLNTRSTT